MNSIKQEKEVYDLVYFGQGEQEGSLELNNEFKQTIEEFFPEVELRDAHDYIKGYRQEVRLPNHREQEYYAWVIGKGWFRCSLNFQLMAMGDSTEEKEKIRSYFEKAKELYPEAFKK